MITITATPIPTNFSGTPQEWLDAFLDRVEITSDVVGFITADEMPESNSGVWLKNGSQIWTWSDDESAYVPLDVSASITDEISVGTTAPDPTEFSIWLKISTTAVLGLYFYMGSELGWITQDVSIADGSITSAKLASDSVSTVKIVDGAVTSVKLAGSIPLSKFENGTALQFFRMNSGGTASDWETVFSVSSEQDITLPGVVEVSHNLPATPQVVQAVIVCKVSGNSWVEADEVPVECVFSSSADNEQPCSQWKNATKAGVRFPTGALIKNKDTSGATAMTAGNWKLKFYFTSR